MEYSAGGFKWYTHVKHTRAVIELMELDMLGSMPPPIPGSECCLGTFFDSAGRPLRHTEDGLDEDTTADRSAARTLLDHALDMPDMQFLVKPHEPQKEKHLTLLKHIARLSDPRAQGADVDHGFNRHRLGFERMRSTLSVFSTALFWEVTCHTAADCSQQCSGLSMCFARK